MTTAADHAPNEATALQIAAAHPERSTWLSANAGSGKTRVLTDRVARLLLGGTEPQHILCLTYTKAAASEMQNRLFARLGSWAMKPDAALRDELSELGVSGSIPAETLSHARTLFARAIETPGGLKIQTIHSFCASLLRRFPLEAGVSPQFSEMESRQAKRLRDEVIEEIAMGSGCNALDRAARYLSDQDFSGLADRVNTYREIFAHPAPRGEIFDWFGLPAGFDRDMLLREVFLGDEPALVHDLVAGLANGSALDIKAAAKIGAGWQPDMAGLERLESVLLYGATTTANAPFSAKIDGFPTKATRKNLAHLMPRLEALMMRVEAARARRLALAAAERTDALHRFAEAFLPAYTERKSRAALLDFDDLILKARDLLSRSEVAQWVLYRLDGGLDHILVDEAQDTNPLQWRVIELLSQEFTAGEGARNETARTIFVVGDKKQSIYSFQGADPAAFDRMREMFDARLGAVGRGLQSLQMEFSFRSSAAILALTDACFDVTQGHGVGGPTRHRAFFDAMPGRVDLWPFLEKEQEDKGEREWWRPVDTPASNDPQLVLAGEIAAFIRDQVANGVITGQDGVVRPIEPGDFLILVRKRSGVFGSIIQACKRMGLEIAGADVIQLGADLAVKDLLALLGFLATQDDDLSLAVALKSPLFDWTEAQLYDLAQGRSEKFLWRELYRRRADFPGTYAVLDDLRAQADFLRPYDLLERVLIRHGGRRRFLERLGEECEDGIDALLAQALAYEQSEVPSLTGFIGWMAAEEVKIKRQIDRASNQIRVMTVHGAKGLEAPIVILPETHKPQNQDRDQIVPLDESRLAWKTNADDAPAVMQAAVTLRREAAEQERRRLLYVAATRAERWLIVCGAGVRGKDHESWYNIFDQAITANGHRPCDTPLGVGKRVAHLDWPTAPVARAGTPRTAPERPEWLDRTAVTPAAPEPWLTPSDLGGAKALPGDGAVLDEEAAKRRGRQLHLLLEHLPAQDEADWAAVAQAVLGEGADAALPDELAALLAEAAGVLRAPHLRALFAPDALAEVSFAARMPSLGGREMRGVIDRLIVAPDLVRVIDYKSNAVVPPDPDAVPEGLLRQMGAYAEALGEIYPGRRIAPEILWTRTARLMALPHDMVIAAMRRAATS